MAQVLGISALTLATHDMARSVRFYTALGFEVNYGGMDAAFTKPFEFSARDALRWEWAQPLYDSMQATVLSLASSPADRTYLSTIGNHADSRLASDIGDSFPKGRAAAAVLMLQPFAPVILAGRFSFFFSKQMRTRWSVASKTAR